MNFLWIIIGASLLVYLCRLGGFVLPSATQSPLWASIWHMLPIVIFSILFASPLVRQWDAIIEKFIALTLTGIIVWRTRQLGLAILLGFGLFWLCLNGFP